MGVEFYDCARCKTTIADCEEHGTCDSCRRRYCSECFSHVRTVVLANMDACLVDAAGENAMRLYAHIDVADGPEHCNPLVPAERQQLERDLGDPDCYSAYSVLRCVACSDDEHVRSIFEGDELVQFLLRRAGLERAQVPALMRAEMRERMAHKRAALERDRNERAPPVPSSSSSSASMKRVHSDDDNPVSAAKRTTTAPGDSLPVEQIQ